MFLMSPKRYYTFMIEPDMIEDLKRAKEAHPELSEGAIVRQALREWLERHAKKSTRKQVAPRKRV
jgi:hypothetical protein